MKNWSEIICSHCKQSAALIELLPDNYVVVGQVICKRCFTIDDIDDLMGPGRPVLIENVGSKD